MNYLDQYKGAIAELCRQYSVRELYVFGSVLSGERFSAASDIDFAAVFDQSQIKGCFDRYMDFKSALESLLGHPVDVISLKSARNKVFLEELNSTKEIVYAA